MFRALTAQQQVVRLPVLEALRYYPRNMLIGIGAHIADTAADLSLRDVHRLLRDHPTRHPPFHGSHRSDPLRVGRIVLQPVYGALSDRIGRKPLNVFSVVFLAVSIFPFFLLLETRQPVLVVLSLMVATALGVAPMIAVQPAFYAELFGARVRYSGFATSREVGAALAGFTPLVAAALVTDDGDPWWVAVLMIGLCVISLIAFLAAPEMKDRDMNEAGPAALAPGQ